jgi:hypothetical protein
MMYLIFRCDCGRAVYSKEGVASKKCVCGKNLKIKERRIISMVEEAEQASDRLESFKKRNTAEHISQLQIKFQINAKRFTKSLCQHD